MKRMLIVEDDPAMSIALSASFTREGFECVTAADGREGLLRGLHRDVDVVLLDVVLPGMNGRDICERLRHAWPEVPILMMTALGHELDIVAALRMGADDYIVKPFGFHELSARVEAVMRRRLGRPSPMRLSTVSFDGITLDFEKREAWKSGRQLELSPRDFDILDYFVQHHGKVITRADLAPLLECDERSVTARLLDTYVWRLRQNIERDPAQPRNLVTVHGRGYRFVAELSRSPEAEPLHTSPRS